MRGGLSLFIDDDGSYVLRGRLDPEVGALLERALEMAARTCTGARPFGGTGEFAANPAHHQGWSVSVHGS